MNLAQQRRYALAFHRWQVRHERRARQLVRSWLQRLYEGIAGSLERIGLAHTLTNLSDLIPTQPVADLLRVIYRTVGSDAAKREFDRLPKLTPLHAQAGFFSRTWQQTLSRLLSSPDTASRITQITETTRQQVRAVLVQANAENLSVRDAARRVSELLGGKPAANRALLIARTETTRAASAGHEVGAMATGLTLNKIWIATADTRTRDSHRAVLSQKPVPKDGYFLIGGVRMKYPGDPAGGAANVCNCRCTVAYVPAMDRVDYMAGGAEDGSVDHPAFVAAGSVKEAETYAKRFFREVSYKGLSPDQANRINQQLDGMYRSLRLDEIEFKIGAFGAKDLRGNIGMSTQKMGRTTLSINKSIYATPESEQAYVARARKNLILKPGRARYNMATDPAIDSLKATIAHEMGHQLDYEFTLLTFVNQLSAWPVGEWKELIGPMSAYGRESVEELFCELTAAYFTGHQELIPAKLKAAYESHLEWMNGIITKRIERSNHERKRRKYGVRVL